jgi:hypothetical protein
MAPHQLRLRRPARDYSRFYDLAASEADLARNRNRRLFNRCGGDDILSGAGAEHFTSAPSARR